MPKIRTHKATAKRIKITGTGKIMGTHGFANHKRRAKTPRMRRQLDDMSVVTPGTARRIRRLVPGLRIKR